MNSNKILPSGQKESKLFPRFGLPKYANRFPKVIDKISFLVEENDLSLEDLEELTRRINDEIRSDESHLPV